MTLLIFFILLSVGVSFLCSMLEAVILSVTPTYLHSLSKKNPKLFKKVQHLKNDIEKPLASILTFNTIAHTVGAAGAGAEAQRIFGSEVLAIFSAILTFVILFFSEIIPKSIGASSWKGLLPFCSIILGPMIKISFPLVWLSEKISLLFKKEEQKISRDEIEAMADMGLNEGAIEKSEHRALKALIQFEKIKATEILSKLDILKSLHINISLKEAFSQIQSHTYSRIIVYGHDLNDIKGYILRTSLQDRYIKDSDELVRDITLPLLILPHTVALQKLLQRLLVRREHICAIIDDNGEVLGVITLEDLIEHMLDLDIYDEQDNITHN